MIEAWRPLLFADEDQAAKVKRDPVAPAKRSSCRARESPHAHHRTRRAGTQSAYPHRRTRHPRAQYLPHARRPRTSGNLRLAHHADRLAAPRLRAGRKNHRVVRTRTPEIHACICHTWILSRDASRNFSLTPAEASRHSNTQKLFPFALAKVSQPARPFLPGIPGCCARIRFLQSNSTMNFRIEQIDTIFGIYECIVGWRGNGHVTELCLLLVRVCVVKKSCPSQPL